MNLSHADAIFGQVDKSLHYIRYQMYLNNAFIRCRVVLAPDLCVCTFNGTAWEDNYSYDEWKPMTTRKELLANTI